MRIDAECRRALLDRNVASLREMSVEELLHFARLRDTGVLVKLPATYLGIVGEQPAGPGPGEGGIAALRAHFWEPSSPADVAVTRATLNVGIEMLADERGAPALLLLPGPYPAVCHPHVAPKLPGPVCLLDEWRADEMTLADVCRGLVEMLRFSPGTWSTERSRALAPKIAEWLAGPGADLFNFPLVAHRPSPRGVRVLERTEEAS